MVLFIICIDIENVGGLHTKRSAFARSMSVIVYETTFFNYHKFCHGVFFCNTLKLVFYVYCYYIFMFTEGTRNLGFDECQQWLQFP
jgi:hypothetical protein